VGPSVWPELAKVTGQATRFRLCYQFCQCTRWNAFDVVVRMRCLSGSYVSRTFGRGSALCHLVSDRPRVRSLAPLIVVLVLASFGHAQLQTRTLVINGHSGQVTIYHVQGKSFIDLETLVRTANGTVSFKGDEIILTLPAAGATSAQASPPQSEGMTKGFMSAAVQNLASIKDWQTTMAYAIQRGVPGDGSRLVILHDRAAEGLRLAKVQAHTASDENALQLLTNHFNQVDSWKRRLVDARKSMSTANYSASADALQNDPEYQKIVSCYQFLATMLPSGEYQDNPACR
jgi:hypothetical protein